MPPSLAALLDLKPRLGCPYKVNLGTKNRTSPTGWFVDLFGRIEGASPLFSAKVWKEAALLECKNVDTGLLANDEVLRNKKELLKERQETNAVQIPSAEKC